MFSTVAIANTFIESAARRGIPLTPLKLMKLVYIAHGWWLAQRLSPLIPDEVQAWKFGPVIPALYQRTKQWGRGEITSKIPTWYFDSANAELPSEATRFVEAVLDSYGKFDGIALSNLTHRPGTPWSHMYRDGLLNNAIPNDAIKAHYQELLRERASVQR
jgi:uncharacterized phage-associated protein